MYNYFVLRATTIETAWEPVLRLHSQVEQAVTKQLRRAGIGVSEYRALRALSDAPKHEIRLLDVADMLSLTQSSTSRLVDRLVSGGSAYRDSCGDDKRGVYVVITETGINLAEHTRPIYEQALRGALADAADDRALAPLVDTIRSGPI
jgi:DNA-binding MarR family transcriptional regulator